MDENKVIAMLCAWLEANDYEILQRLATTKQGIDIIARNRASGRMLYVEAKGGTSSREGSARFGKPYTQTQVFDRVAKGVFTSLQLLGRRSEGEFADVGLAFPAGRWEELYVKSVASPLARLGIRVFLVAADASVREAG